MSRQRYSVAPHPIETVTEIFIRVNSAGVELSQADFAMSKIATNETYGGNLYGPTYTDMLRVAFTSEFIRGKLLDLVALHSRVDARRDDSIDQLEKCLAQRTTTETLFTIRWAVV